jgi:hypothetical protein
LTSKLPSMIFSYTFEGYPWHSSIRWHVHLGGPAPC